MAAESTQSYAALEAQAQRIMPVLVKAGYELVAPAIIQPADVFLDAIGENLRGRTYVFTDPDGEELCLRPDLTVPTCRLHLERHGISPPPAKYCYNGPCFRFQPGGGSAAHPREFRQAGIESIGATDLEVAEVEIAATTVAALRAAGLGDVAIRLGDLGLFQALIRSVDMPERWRNRLRHHFWRPDAFRGELRRLATDPSVAVEGLPAALVRSLDPDDPAGAVALVEAYLNEQSIEMIGARSAEEIAEHLLDTAADLRAMPLPREALNLIESYVRIAGPSRHAGARLQDLVQRSGIDISAALSAYNRRLDLLSRSGIDVDRAEFSAEFGRNLEYYTGFVFEVIAPAFGPASPVAGGGRYDALMRVVGAGTDVPAVGSAIHTERLLEAAGKGARS